VLTPHDQPITVSAIVTSVIPSIDLSIRGTLAMKY
jgi:hypothetical protein